MIFLAGCVLSDFSAADDTDNADLFVYSNTETQRHREKFIYKTDKIKTPCLRDSVFLI